MTIKLGVQDLMPRHEGVTTAQAFQDSLALAQYVEKLGYHRYWFSEHHNTDSLLSSAPEIMAAYLAGVTEHLRVGTGGTMVMHYAPLKVAEEFKMLSALAPGRIDFGIGRAPGGDLMAIDLLANGHAPQVDDQYERIEIIFQLLQDLPGKAGDYAQALAAPTRIPQLPEPWLLGSSGQSAHYAAEHGLGYSFATFFGMHYSPTIYADYRRHFQPSAFFQTPHLSACYEVICAEDSATVAALARPVEIQRIQQYHFQQNGYLSPEHARHVPISASDQDLLAEYYQRRVLIKGTPDQVAEQLSAEVEQYQLDEILIYSPIADLKQRQKNYALIWEGMRDYLA